MIYVKSNHDSCTNKKYKNVKQKMGVDVLFFALSQMVYAQETLDLGVLDYSDLQVVQNQLYTKKGKSEMGVQGALMPFNPYTITPKVEFSYAQHMQENFGWEVAIGGGYSLKNGAFRTLESPSYAISPDAYRYLSSALAHVQYSPIYAKMTWNGKDVYHHDIFFIGGGGVTIEQAFLADNSIAVSPTLSLGIGSRIYNTKTSSFRVQFRDDLVLQGRAKTSDIQKLYFKHNLMLSFGYTILG
jgi:outer membrane beta-barrel protein